jgi:hypothetical protein
MALALDKLKISISRKQILTVVGAVVLAAAGGWAALQYFEEAPPPPPKPAAAKQSGPAKPAAPAPEKVIADVLAASGIDQHLNQLPQQLIAGVKQPGATPAKASPAVLGAIETAVTEAFTAQKFRDRLGADLKKNFDAKRMQSLLAEMSTPEAKRMVALEQTAAAPEELAKYARSQAANKQSPQRKDLIKRIDAATHASDLAVEAAFASMKELATGIAGDNAKRAASVDKIIEKQRASATAGIRNSTFSNLAYTYRDASDADLEAYAKAYESENYKWFNGIVYASLLEEAKSAAAQAGDRVGALASKPAVPVIEKAAKPALAAAPAGRASRGGARSSGDARACLDLNANAAISKCAEPYR